MLKYRVIAACLLVLNNISFSFFFFVFGAAPHKKSTEK